MRLSFNSIINRALTLLVIMLSCIIVYQYKAHPHRTPAPVQLFPTITLHDNLTLHPGMPQAGDNVLIMKRLIGMVTHNHVSGYYCDVSYFSQDGTAKTGTFPYTVLEKVHIKK